MSKHYVAMAGLHGCIPNSCQSYDTRQDAIEDLANLHELGKNRKSILRRDNYLELNLGRDGNEYCEIIECECDNPGVHNDN